MAGAVAWSAGARWTSQILSWASTIIVARILTPADYGVVGMAGVYLCFATFISQVGISDTVIALRDLTRRQIAELNTISLLVGSGLVVMSWLVAPLIASFFSSPALRAVVVVAGSTYVLSGLRVVPSALLRKELRFKLLSVIGVVSVISQVVVTIVLALLHFGYWSLILGTIAASVVGTTLVLAWKRQEFAIPRFDGLRRELTFGRHTFIGGVAWYVYDNADFAVAGRMLGSVALGNYTVAWTVASAPVEKIATLVTGVTPAVFSVVQTSKYELRRYFLGISEILALVMTPAGVGIALTADCLVTGVLGTKWHFAIAPLRLLAIVLAVRCLAEIPMRILTAIGDTRFGMWCGISLAVVMPIAFFLGSRWGPTGVAAGWLIAYPPMLVPIYYRTFRKTDTRLYHFVSAVLPALTASLIMAAAVILIRTIFPLQASSIVDLIILVLAGVISYAAALFILFRERLIRIFRIIRNIRHTQVRQVPVTLQEAEPIS